MINQIFRLCWRTALVLFIVAGIVLADNYKFTRQVISSGGTVGTSTSFKVSASAAQAAAGFGTSASFQSSQGYWPLLGSLGCCVGRVGDANGAGGDEPTIGDISVLIDALFISGNTGVISCLTEADINQSGGANPTAGDITIGDISVLIDYLFVTGPTLGLPNCL